MALGEGGEHGIGPALDDLEVYIGVPGAELRDFIRQKAVVHRADGGDADDHLLLLGDGLDVPGSLLQQCENGLSTLPQEPPLWGDVQAALVAEKEGGAQLLLQGLELKAQGRLGNIQALGRPGDAPHFGNLQEVLKLL